MPSRLSFSSPLRTRGALPIIVFVILVLLLGSLMYFSDRKPVIEAVEPESAGPGEAVTIRGRFFGDGGSVRLAGRQLQPSNLEDWSNEAVRIRLPADATSGLVYVVSESRRSNGVFLSLQPEVPEADSASLTPRAPVIESITPEEVSVGDRVTLRGRRFGNRRGDSVVLFRWRAGPEGADGAVGRIGVAAAEFGYESWSDHAVTVRVPDGAVSGPVVVKGSHGESEPAEIEIVRRVGSKTYERPQSHAVYNEVGLWRAARSASGDSAGADSAGGDGEAAAPSEGGGAASANSADDNPSAVSEEVEPRLYLWLPTLREGPEQRNVQLLRRTHEPLFDPSVAGTTVYAFEPSAIPRADDVERAYEELAGTAAGSDSAFGLQAAYLQRSSALRPETLRVGHAYLLDRYAVDTEIIRQRVPAEYDMSDRFMQQFTSGDRYLPVNADFIRERASRLVSPGGNPAGKAEVIYTFVREWLDPIAEAGNVDAATGYQTRQGNAFTYATLFTSLLRASGVPSRLVAGHIVTSAGDTDRGTWIRHYWAEFFIQGLGWIPADPALGDGLYRERFARVDEPASFYFGDLDAYHITYSGGVVPTKAVTSSQTRRVVPEMYALQQHYEQRVGIGDEYRTRWYGVVPIGE
jgi:transglutaminase-like putative cysteine protease